MSIIEATDAETAEEQFAIDFTIMVGEFRKMMADLTEALGGVAK